MLFALEDSRLFGEKIAAKLGISLAQHEERAFEDGEHKGRPLENVRNRDVFILQSLYGSEDASVNDKLCHLLFFIGAIKDASAKSIAVVTPYLCYARKDRRTKARDPVTTRYLAQLLEAVGTNRVITIDIHNLQAFQNSFRCPTEHLEAKNLFARYFIKELHGKEMAVMSPDFGGAKRAEEFRKVLVASTGKEIPLIIMEKSRSKGEVTGSTIVGQVKGKSVIIIDDMISSGGTMARAALACKELGAEAVFATATHGLFTKKAPELLKESLLSKIVITDTVSLNPRVQQLLKEKIKVLEIAPFFAEAIKRIYAGDSIVELLGNE